MTKKIPLDQLPDTFRSVVVEIPEPPKLGDTRVINKRYYAGAHLFIREFDGGILKLTHDITMDVTEKFTKFDTWDTVQHHIDTAKPVFTWWEKVKNWFRTKPARLPEARLLK